MITSLKRVIKNGWKGFSRNPGLNIATIFIMIMVILLISILFLLNPVSDALVSGIQNRVDISVYLNEGTFVEDIMVLKSEMARIPEVKEVEYISKEQALETFIEKHKDDPVLIESLTEVGYNPFLDYLNIKAHDPSKYGEVVVFLETSSYKDMINKIDYHQREPVIQKVLALTSGINKAGVVLGVIFSIIALFIAFNTIRIAIHSSNKEISVMKLVGASNWFARGPFVVQGVIIGFISALITLLIVFILCYGFNAKVNSVTSDVNLYSIFLNNILVLFLIQLGVGIGLGVVSSYIAIRKYLNK